MSVRQVPLNEALDALFIAAQNHTFFTVCFIKRTTGEERIMEASTNYKSLLKGGEAAYDAISKGLLVVRDREKGAIRSIATESILWIRANGEQLEVTR